jgi:UDP-N-acetylmuramoyl-L-alanyl-D-glutamate--2,6-diaminopimelate ligase
MRLDELTGGLAAAIHGGEVLGAAGAEISSLAYDSRAVTPGALFFCVPGFQSDGHDFAAQAVADGAAALAVERPLELRVPEAVFSSVREAMGPIAARFFGDPTSQLAVVGITGTNGKTTTAYLVRALLEASGMQCGLLGTVTSIVGGQERAVTRTTPEAVDLQRDFAEMLQAGDRACAMEVSSHALALGRCDAIRFAAAVFTNISRDHLDFHGTMEDYFAAKRRLFCPPESAPAPSPRASVLNVGDPYGRQLAAEVQGAVTFAVDAPADFSARDVRCHVGGCRFTLHAPGAEREVALPLPGRFNVANALGALAAATALGCELEAAAQALEAGVRVPGRLEPVDEGQHFAVLVDYAHTPDSLENVLRTARELASLGEAAAGRVVCVFGAGGDRDRGKRPLMGEIAARMSDIAIVTSDNPRSEDPDAIIAEIVAGVREQDRERVQRTPDRAAAIAQAVALARAGDIVLIAGKGHEQGQELAGGRKVPFDDVTVAREALRSARDASVALSSR